MRKLTIFATLIALFVGLDAQNAEAQWPQTTHRDTRMSVEIGAKAFDRPGTETPGSVLTDSLTGSTLFSAEQATDLGTNFGAEVKFNFISQMDREIEVRTILANWDESSSFTGANLASPFFPAPTPGVPPPSQFDYNYDADYFSIEVMRRRAILPGLTVMAGPRIVSTSDEINTVGTTALGLTNLTQSDMFEAENTMLGLQAGFELNFPVCNSIYANSFIRGGGYYNSTKFNTSTTNSFTGLTTSNRRTDSNEAFLGEVGGRLNVDLVPNCFSTYVGYEATWIDGIALAPANAAVTPVTGIDTANTSFFHAVTFGVQLLY